MRKTEENVAEMFQMGMPIRINRNHKSNSMRRAINRSERGNTGKIVRSKTEKWKDTEDDKFENKRVDYMNRLLEKKSKGNDGASRIGTGGKGTN